MRSSAGSWAAGSGADTRTLEASARAWAMRSSAEAGMLGSSARAWAMGSSAEAEAAGWTTWTPQTLERLLPDLSVEERARLTRPFPGRQCIRLKYPGIPPPPIPDGFKGLHDDFMIPRVRHALDHYNARHPGDEFDAVKPLAEASVHFRGQLWWHLNFWSRSRSNNKIKRFFAELHYQPATSGDLHPEQPFLPPIPIVQLCIIIEEPLDRYRTSCAFCCSHLNILHPIDDHTVCGNNEYLQGTHQCAAWQAFRAWYTARARDAMDAARA